MVYTFEDFDLTLDLEGYSTLPFYDSILSFRKGIPDVIFRILQTEEIIILWHDNIRKHVKLKIESNGCWECFSHSLDSDGYPKICVNSRTRRMLRLIYCVYNKKCWTHLPELLRHDCDNRLCVCPGHLRPGDRQSNAWDMIYRERNLSGIKNPQSKLSEEDISYILSSERDNNYLADVLNVHVRTIERVKGNKTYKKEIANTNYKDTCV